MNLSVIVPVYNVAGYLKKCIESIYIQDLEIDSYEVIAVNDGSTDTSLEVLNELRQKYHTLNIVSQENQGLSGARNTGLEYAKGKYILFVDSDDTILPNILSELVKLSDLNKLDMLEFGAAGISEDNKITYKAQATTNSKVLTGEEYLHQINYINSACNKFYNLDFLNKHHLRFMPNVYIEDIEFNTQAVFYSKRIMAIDTIMAHFLQRDGSITRTVNFSKTKKMVYDIYTVLKSIDTFNEEKVTANSVAYIPLKKRVSNLVATMLLRAFKDTPDSQIAKDLITKLKKDNLYPIVYSPSSSSKKLFSKFINIEWLFLVVTKIISKIKGNKYEE